MLKKPLSSSPNTLRTMNEYKNNSRIFFNEHHNDYGSSDKADSKITSIILKNNTTTVLDLSCGNGRTADAVLLACPAVNINGVDISDKSIEFAQNRNLKNATFFVSDAEKLPFDDNYFECIFCINSFHHYPKPQQCFNEISRTLEDNGIFILVDIYMWPIFRQITNLLLPYTHKKEGDYKIHSKKELLTMANNSGLKIAEFSYINIYMCCATFKK